MSDALTDYWGRKTPNLSHKFFLSIQRRAPRCRITGMGTNCCTYTSWDRGQLG